MSSLSFFLPFQFFWCWKCLNDFCFCHLFLWGMVIIFIQFRVYTGSLLLACGVIPVGANSFMQIPFEFFTEVQDNHYEKTAIICWWVSSHWQGYTSKWLTRLFLKENSFWIALVKKMYRMRHYVTSNKTSIQIQSTSFTKRQNGDWVQFEQIFCISIRESFHHSPGGLRFWCYSLMLYSSLMILVHLLFWCVCFSSISLFWQTLL